MENGKMKNPKYNDKYFIEELDKINNLDVSKSLSWKLLTSQFKYYYPEEYLLWKMKQ